MGTLIPTEWTVRASTGAGIREGTPRESYRQAQLGNSFPRNEAAPEGEPRQEFENTRGCPTRVVAPAQAAAQTQFSPVSLGISPPAMPGTPDFSTADNKGGGGAAAAVTQRGARPRPAPPLPSGAAGPAPRVWRGRADTRRHRAGSGRSSPALSAPPARVPRAAGRAEPPRRDTVNKDTEPKDPFPIPRKIMAEPDYIDDDNPELIRPQKLINPVKSSRNHQDLHRELLMNQKRGLAPQNKPELQKVMEKRKRDQVIKQQKEEEAQKKKSDLEIELLKRQQKLEQELLMGSAFGQMDPAPANRNGPALNDSACGKI
uniref:Family with sequence similarity 107 member B n=1 Tax=Taeniopygia guttata TaxID=59729 RepID=A0A674GFC8_TAEGU